MHEGGGRLPPSENLGADFLCAVQVTGALLERSPSSGSHLGALCFPPIAPLQTPNPTAAQSRAPTPAAFSTAFSWVEADSQAQAAMSRVAAHGSVQVPSPLTCCAFC